MVHLALGGGLWWRRRGSRPHAAAWQTTPCSLGSLARLSGRQNQHLPEWRRRRGRRAQGFPPAHLPTPPAAGQREEAQAALLCRAPNTGPGEASFVFSLLSVHVPAGRWGREGLGPERTLREHGVGCRQESWHWRQVVALAAGRCSHSAAENPEAQGPHLPGSRIPGPERGPVLTLRTRPALCPTHVKASIQCADLTLTKGYLIPTMPRVLWLAEAEGEGSPYLLPVWWRREGSGHDLP